MGIFGSTKTYVSSTLYNLAGDEAKRPDYLKSLVVGNVITNSKFSVADTVRSGYVKGPGIRLRTFFKWAQTNYGAIGVPEGTLGGRANIDYSVVAGQISHPVGTTVRVQYVKVDTADYAYWAEQWMFENHPTLVDTAWSSDIDENTGLITVTFADTTTATFAPTDFVKNAEYLYVVYHLTKDGGSSAVTTGATTSIGSTTPFPSTAGFTLESHDVDGIIEETETWVYTKTEYKGTDPTPGTDGTYSLKTSLIHVEERDILGDVTSRTTRTDTQDIYHRTWETTKYLIYRIGSGNAVLDALVQDETEDGEYFPFIPLRLDNKFLSTTYEPAAYALAKRAYRRASGQNMDKLIETLSESESLADIDYAYVMYGVTLNALDASARQYLYRFFDRCRAVQTSTTAGYSTYHSGLEAYDLDVAAWAEWKAAQSDELDPLFHTPEPTIRTRPTDGGNWITIKSNGTLNTNLNMKIGWQLIEEEVGSGLFDPGRKPGEVWLDLVPLAAGEKDKIYFKSQVFTGERYDNTRFTITWQVTETLWKKLTISGAVHENLIYNGKSVRTTPKDAFEDAEDSGFLVPLHYATVREMRLVDSTQMCSACTFLVLNSYLVKKTGFLASILSIFSFIVAIALAIVFPPLAATFSTIGTALGLTGLAAIVVGGVIFTLASMVLTKIVTKVAILAFGEKLGAIIGAILSFFAVSAGTGLLNGQSLSALWGNLMSPIGIYSLTNAVGSGIAGWVQASTMDVQAKTQDLMEEYEQDSKKVSDLFAQNIGYGTGQIDPMSLTDIRLGNSMETSSQFLSRTLMTGTDIAEMSLAMLTNFADLTLSTELLPDG